MAPDRIDVPARFGSRPTLLLCSACIGPSEPAAQQQLLHLFFNRGTVPAIQLLFCTALALFCGLFHTIILDVHWMIGTSSLCCFFCSAAALRLTEDSVSGVSAVSISAGCDSEESRR